MTEATMFASPARGPIMLVSTTLRAALRAQLMTPWLIFMVSLSACTYESSSLSGLICEDEGAREAGRVCRDGVWVQEDGVDLPVSELPDSPDMPVDMPDQPEDLPDIPCVPEDDATLCLGQSAACGSISVMDRCGVQRDVASCGTCPDNGVCMGNSCGACVPEDDAAFCAREGKACGVFSGVDNCGMTRTDAGCGVCAGAGESCVDNACVCIPETDEQYCGRLGAQCGLVRSGMDNCGTTRVDVMCGGCAQGSCQQDNTCSVCQPETDAAFCARNGATCGSKAAMDNCGTQRTVMCGPNNGVCGADEQCNNNQCTCPAPACPGGSQCGSVSNACGRSSGSCGTCTNETVCNGSNMCTCPTPVCPAGAQCGMVMNACGNSVRCGANNGACGAAEQCMGNACVCAPETDAAFCTRTGAACGSKTAADNCGVPRTVANCGTCAMAQTCGANNQCACAPETDAAFCARTGATCGSKTAADNCGTPRTVASCGSCGAFDACVLNACVLCTAESDVSFCARTGAACGSKTAADNCGTSRTVANCGTCAMAQTCGANNQCACAPETDAALCMRAGAACGSVTVADNCGVMRTVADCGACSNGEICGSSTVNTCSLPFVVALMPSASDNDIFGSSVVVRGDILIVGKPDGDGHGHTDEGAVHVYKRNANGSWSWSQTLTPADGASGATNDYFGTSLAFDGATLVVGAPQYNFKDDTATDNKGYVLTYALSGGAFTYQDKLSPENVAGNVDASINSRYGWSVGVSGDRLVVGVPHQGDGGKERVGIVVIWTRANNMASWGSAQRRRASDNSGGGTATGDLFGTSVALSGDTLVVGAPGRSGSGMVVTFEQTSANTWARRNNITGGAASDELLGTSVSLSGTRAAAGAPAANKVYIMENLLAANAATSQSVTHTGAAAGDRHGASVWIDGNTLVAGAPGRSTASGRAYRFTRAGNNTWSQSDELAAPAAQRGNNDAFGAAVCMDGARIVVAAPQRSVSGKPDAGIVFIYNYP
jgi:hypothetical protein